MIYRLPSRLTRAQRVDLMRYMAAEWRGGTPTRADWTLALLRLGHRAAAEAMMGRPITVCPPSVPRWPPAAPDTRSRPRVTRVLDPNPCQPKSDARRRFAKIRAGDTVESLLGRGITPRDVRVWQARGWITIGVQP